jgi:hypothetical protein
MCMARVAVERSVGRVAALLVFRSSAPFVPDDQLS